MTEFSLLIVAFVEMRQLKTFCDFFVIWKIADVLFTVRCAQISQKQQSCVF